MARLRFSDDERKTKLLAKFRRYELWYILKKLDGDHLLLNGYTFNQKWHMAETIIKHIRETKWKLSSLDYALENTVPGNLDRFIMIIQSGTDENNFDN